MAGRGGRVDPGTAGRLARRERAALGERGEHRAARRVADQRRHGCQVPVEHAIEAAASTIRPGPKRPLPDVGPVNATEEIEHIYTAWDEALGAKDLEAVLALYHPDAVLESPLVCYLLGTADGVVRGREELRRFVEKVFANQPAARRRHRTGYVTDGTRLVWEYPREAPDGDQMDLVEVMEIRDGLIARHRVYWGWVGVGLLQRGEHPR